MKRLLLMVCASALLVTACTSKLEGDGTPSKDTVSVSVHGVNYTAEPFTFTVAKPGEAEDAGVGEHVGPFSAGGIVCCFTLPRKWIPGTKLEVRATEWVQGSEKDHTNPVTRSHIVDVPPYQGGKAGELWVLRNTNGTIEVVSSDLQPNHPEWPGKMKGWPVPSVQFRRERWELLYSQEKRSIENSKSLLRDLHDDPKKFAQEQWEHDRQYDRQSLEKFSGPADPAYLRFVENRLTTVLRSAQASLEELEREKP